MVLVLCIGDLHIPHRAVDLPQKFKQLLVPGKIHYILSPGNLCSQEVLEYFKSVCSNTHITKGDFDDDSSFADNEVLELGDFRIGVCHGHQVVPCGDTDALALLQRRLNVDILVSGHTHEFMAMQHEDRILINPGSATGAFSSLNPSAHPSFVLMDINGSKASVYLYNLIEEEVRVEKMEFTKAASKLI
ncbi:hypothetical protein WJX74_003511 [Apatococcus lobatus]|uniref:Vacuolar protein sorting-associated protein 29 n=1 Tax=Apatococcus lobatus TaxID=904363 RepID=A0AAW1SG36_9CHLO